MPSKINLYLLYFTSILKTNALVSVLLTILSILVSFDQPILHSPVFIGLSSYIAWIMSGGFILSQLYYQFSRSNEYYFYYNRGLTKVKLIAIAYLFHFIVISPLLLILLYV